MDILFIKSNVRATGSGSFLLQVVKPGTARPLTGEDDWSKYLLRVKLMDKFKIQGDEHQMLNQYLILPKPEGQGMGNSQSLHAVVFV